MKVKTPKHVGFTGINIPRIPVVIWDEMPFPFALVMTSQQFAAIQANKGMAIQTEGVAVDAEEEGEPCNHTPVTLERDLRFPPDPNKWCRTPDNEVIIGCPKCGGAQPIKSPPHEVGEDGYVQPSFRCQNPKCNLHCMIRLEGVRTEDGKCTTCGCDFHPSECETPKGGKPCGCLSGTGWEPRHVKGWPPGEETN